MTETTEAFRPPGDAPQAPTQWVAILVLIIVLAVLFAAIVLGLLSILGGDSDVGTRGTVGGLPN
jgi:hypothetical protein